MNVEDFPAVTGLIRPLFELVKHFSRCFFHVRVYEMAMEEFERNSSLKV